MQAAAAALERHAAAARAAALPQPLTAAQLASLATPDSGISGARQGSAGAQGLERLLEDSWLGLPPGAARGLDRGERAASTKDEAEAEEGSQGPVADSAAALEAAA